MHSPGPKLSIVIPVYNEERAIDACLKSMASQDVEQPYEVVLVDNGCTDQTITVARAASSRFDLRIVNEPRHGRGAARRSGFLVARGEIIFSADADTVYPPTWMSQLLRALEEQDVVAATTTAKFEDLAAWQNYLLNIGQPLAMWLYRVVVGHHCLSGFSFAVRRAAYQTAGGFDAELNADEDADLSRRIARLGRIRLIHTPVTMSGRRFSRGLIAGAFAYLRLYWQYRFGRTRASLSDVR